MPFFAGKKEGRLRPIRTPGGRRRYRREDIQALLGLEEAPREALQVGLYARVSTRRQEVLPKGQMARLEAWARGRGCAT
jgi:putative resolvase